VRRTWRNLARRGETVVGLTKLCTAERLLSKKARVRTDVLPRGTPTST
jgi:hypothetical protein